MSSALLEIFVESLPARFLPPALAQLQQLSARRLGEARLDYAELKVYGTPMRLAVWIGGLGAKSRPEAREAAGPPARLWKEADGSFTKQAAGFARAQGVAPEELVLRSGPKGEYLAAVKLLPGEPAQAVLGRVFPELVAGLEFPKSMVWEESRFRFARPIRGLLALHGRRIVPFSLAGVRAGNKTRALAALGGRPFAVPAPDRYLALLRDRCVLADPDERRAALLKSLASAAKRSSGEVELDLELIEHVLGLVEHPVAVLGKFDKAYLELPKALLLTVLKKQLIFFPVLAPDGKLEPNFIGVRDGVSEGQNLVRTGFERVLEARLRDARFFFARDRRANLADTLRSLSRVGFQQGLGSMADKSARLRRLARWVGERLLQERELDLSAVDRAAELAYADLVTGVVGEFPELQGTMGGVYARLAGLSEKVALSLEEFYFPVGAKSALPSLLEGAIVSLAAKLDTLAAMFAAGFVPSGSEDPFALRRLGAGVVRIVLEKQLPLPLPEALSMALGALAAAPLNLKLDAARLLGELEDFLWQRVEALLLEKGFRVDEIRSVRDGGLESVAETFRRVAAVRALRPEPDFAALAQAFKRARNILRQAGSDGPAAAEVDRNFFREPAEESLFGALCRVEGDVREKVSQGLYEESLRSLVGLKPELDRFFDEVLVMSEESAVKHNRLGLLARLVRVFTVVADISHIQN